VGKPSPVSTFLEDDPSGCRGPLFHDGCSPRQKSDAVHDTIAPLNTRFRTGLQGSLGGCKCFNAKPLQATLCNRFHRATKSAF
jgi:hypothetical protein